MVPFLANDWTDFVHLPPRLLFKLFREHARVHRALQSINFLLFVLGFWRFHPVRGRKRGFPHVTYCS
ncbi:hypothetical protein A3A39_01925 [Candidatus Kaiserbacteria bacterium RIFCSPLOWO2_01_FULL_54_13]|uniref:Uncharacterized protein n=1 Tax=Candidatus Kaiserbacteria bacterium RIFCSPLOWO2_01_FULL_54_13 TaxID=1798512 RepID=A0A1F6F0G7_9BACT|nr:MAG: hypothetical protein A3A39_01925 [Candidatus Kaiserbacteria bacterium RIFCSPLOWO2_01_FULL_54_13]